MAVFPLLAVSFVMKVVAAIFLICAMVLILIILVQKGRGGGLGAALGGGLAGGLLGTKTGDFLTWVTIVLVGIFLTLAVVMAKFYKPSVSGFDTGQTQQPDVRQQQPPAAPAVTGDTTTDANLPGG